MTTLHFSPREVSRDWNRFGGSYITVRRAGGRLLKGGMLELQGVANDHIDFDDEGSFDEGTGWDECTIEYHYFDGESKAIRSGTTRLLPTDTLAFCPKWTYCGYSQVTERHADIPSCVWVSLSGARQYRYGLSSRAFTGRTCGSFHSLGRNVGIGSRDLMEIYRTGPVFHTGPIIPSPSGLALTPTLGIHYVSEGVGALCHNARRILGWHIDGAFRVEEAARKLTRHLENVTYESTESLTGLWSSRIFPQRHGLVTNSSRPGRVRVRNDTLERRVPDESIDWTSEYLDPAVISASPLDLFNPPTNWAVVRRRNRERGDS